VGWRGRLRKRFQLVNGTIAILDKQRATATDKTVCLCNQPNIIRNVLINKTLSEDGQVVLGRQCALDFAVLWPT
jgi:hypothetical protein